ncbi:hypothetical protein HKX48_004371 [Thoreauomyces humboldtii]|nr:hypothetical protein HKX48_004352 [Thoreauomyces humboldtii]KAJ3023077.1 hypothetical protein HKX48_004371 [Thoreauomyces humboldtii]
MEHGAFLLAQQTREGRLRNHLIANPLDGYPILAARDWNPQPGLSHLGEGDLVFASSDRSRYLVVEVKGLHPGTGSTARESRRKAHQKVREQVQRYTNAWAELHPYNEVVGCSYVGFEPVDADFGDVVYPSTPTRHGLMQMTKETGDVKEEEETERMGLGSKLAVTVGVLGLAGLLFGAVSRDRQ